MNSFYLQVLRNMNNKVDGEICLSYIIVGSIQTYINSHFVLIFNKRITLHTDHLSINNKALSLNDNFIGLPHLRKL